jgi:hypothetical protein
MYSVIKPQIVEEKYLLFQKNKWVGLVFGSRFVSNLKLVINSKGQTILEFLLGALFFVIPLSWAIINGGQLTALALAGQWMHHITLREFIYQNCSVTGQFQNELTDKATYHLKNIPGFLSIKFVTHSFGPVCRFKTQVAYERAWPIDAPIHNLQWVFESIQPREIQ